FGGAGCGRERTLRQPGAGEDRDLLLDDQILRYALSRLWCEAGVVPDDQLHLAPRNGVAVLLHVEANRRLGLPAGRREGTGQRKDKPDLDRIGGECPARPPCARSHDRTSGKKSTTRLKRSPAHSSSSVLCRSCVLR